MLGLMLALTGESKKTKAKDRGGKKALHNCDRIDNLPSFGAAGIPVRPQAAAY